MGYGSPCYVKAKPLGLGCKQGSAYEITLVAWSWCTLALESLFKKATSAAGKCCQFWLFYKILDHKIAGNCAPKNIYICLVNLVIQRFSLGIQIFGNIFSKWFLFLYSVVCELKFTNIFSNGISFYGPWLYLLQH